MVFYNIKVDVINYISYNRKNLTYCLLVVLLGVLFGCVFALGVEEVVVDDNSNVYFVFLSTDGGSLGLTVFVSLFVYLLLLVLSKMHWITRKLAVLLIFYRAYEFANRAVLIVKCFGSKCIVAIIVVCIIEILVCLTFSILFLINNTDKYYCSKEFFPLDYLVCVGVVFVILIVLGILLNASYNLVCVFT